MARPEFKLGFIAGACVVGSAVGIVMAAHPWTPDPLTGEPWGPLRVFLAAAFAALVGAVFVGLPILFTVGFLVLGGWDLTELMRGVKRSEKADLLLALLKLGLVSIPAVLLFWLLLRG